MLSAIIIPFTSNNLNASFRKKGYFPLAASINTTSYFPCSVGRISTASPNNIFIFSSTFAFFIFSFACSTLSSSRSIVSIFPSFAKYLVKHIAEYPTAVPISKIFLVFFLLKYYLELLMYRP